MASQLIKPSSGCYKHLKMDYCVLIEYMRAVSCHNYINGDNEEESSLWYLRYLCVGLIQIAYNHWTAISLTKGRPSSYKFKVIQKIMFGQ